jgi:hypothetical protein
MHAGQRRTRTQKFVSMEIYPASAFPNGHSSATDLVRFVQTASAS